MFALFIGIILYLPWGPGHPKLLGKLRQMDAADGINIRFNQYGPYFQPRPLSEILTIANLRHTASRIWTCAEPEFRLRRIKLCSSNNHYTISTCYRTLLSAIWEIFSEFLIFYNLFHESLGEWNNSKIWEMRKIFANIAQGIVR